MTPSFGLATLAALVALPAGATARFPGEVRLGGTLPLSGADAATGASFREGYELAVEQANQRGGVQVGGKRLPVKLILRDDAGDKAAGVSGAERLLADDSVDFLLGTFNSSMVEVQSVVAEKHGVPYVAGGASTAELYARNLRYLFGLQAPVKMLASAEMGWIEEQQKAGRLPRPARLALIAEDTVHGREFRTGALKSVERSPGFWKVVLDEQFPLNAKDFRPLISRVKEAAADVFLADAHMPDFIALHRQYLAAKLCLRVVSYGVRGSEAEAAKALGAENVAYLLSGVFWNDQLGSKGLNREFVEGFRKRYGHSPMFYNALAYESVRAVLAGVEAAGSVDREKVRAALASLKMETILPSGTLNFPADYGQQAHYSFLVLQNQPDGSSPIVYPDYLATAPGQLDPRCARGTTRP